MIARARPALAAVPRAAWLLLALALLVRLVHVALTDDYVPVLDAADYHRHGVSIAGGGGFPESIAAAGGGPSAFRPPLYPYLVGAVYEVVGPRIYAARAAGAVIGAASVGVLGILANQLLGRRVALVAMAVAAVYPPLVLFGNALLSEGSFILLVLAAIGAALRFRAGGGIGWAAASGALVGLAALDRSNGLVLLLPLALTCWRSPRRGRALLAPAALVAAALLVLVPWTVRNVSVFDRFFVVTTQTGFGLAGTYNETSRTDPRLPGAWRPPGIVPELGDVFARGLDEAQTDRVLRERALRFMADHPGYVVSASVRNTGRMLDLTGFGFGEVVAADVGIGRTEARIGIVSFWIVGALAALALLTRAARRLPLAFWLSLGLLAASAVFVSGTSRYRVPLEPFFVVLAAQAVVAGWGRMRA
jgi:hypothetical protein